jgi:hypothetical protein
VPPTSTPQPRIELSFATRCRSHRRKARCSTAGSVKVERPRSGRRKACRGRIKVRIKLGRKVFRSKGRVTKRCRYTTRTRVLVRSRKRLKHARVTVVFSGKKTHALAGPHRVRVH